MNSPEELIKRKLDKITAAVRDADAFLKANYGFVEAEFHDLFWDGEYIHYVFEDRSTVRLRESKVVIRLEAYPQLQPLIEAVRQKAVELFEDIP